MSLLPYRFNANDVHVKSGQAENMLVFVHDAHLFILSNRSIIEKAPLHMYISGLVFSPQVSETREWFRSDTLT